MVGAQGTGYKGGRQAETGGLPGVGKTKRKGSGAGVGAAAVGTRLDGSVPLRMKTGVGVTTGTWQAGSWRLISVGERGILYKRCRLEG